MLSFALLTLLAAAIAAAAICRVHGLPWSLIPRSAALRYGTIVAGVPAVAVGLIARWGSEDWRIGAAAAALSAVPALTWLYRARQRAKPFLSALDSATVDGIVAELRQRRAESGGASLGFAVSVLSSARGFIGGGRLDAAATVLELLEWDRNEDPVIASAASLLAFCYLESNLIREAREVFERGKPHADAHGDRDAYALLDARLLVYEGNYDAALERLRELGPAIERDPELRAQRQVIEIHALAGLGHEEKAVAQIGALQDAYGARAFALLARPTGAASAIAAALSAKNAYR